MIARVFISLVLLFFIILWAGFFYLGPAAKAGIEFAVHSLTLSPRNAKTAFEPYQ